MADAGDWRDTWEQHAEGERRELAVEPVSQLLERLRAGYYGGYYSIWDTVAERSTLEEAGWLLFSVLESGAEYLDRYRCAEALLRLLKSRKWKAVELSAEWGRGQSLPQIEELLTQRVGPRP